MIRIALLYLLCFTFASLSPTAFGWDAKSYKHPTHSEIKKKLNAIQYSVTQESDTEAPYKNTYWDNSREGIYVDVVSGEPLFSSRDKFDSKTGWPSFTKPLVSENIIEKEDKSLFSTRTEVRSRHANSHLGHLFNDGPAPKHNRYCINSSALKFIAKEDLAKEGYAEYTSFFTPTTSNTTEKLILAGGCFWCMEPPFETLIGNGVLSVKAGYSGGSKPNPTYKEVSSGTSGHTEVVQIEFDPNKISLARLLEIFWVNVDPYDQHGQFCDKGEQYVSAIFTQNEAAKEVATNSLKFVKTNSKESGSIQTKILPAQPFYAAEEYHQDYYKKNPLRYKLYRGGCGRDNRLKKVWGSLAEH